MSLVAELLEDATKIISAALGLDRREARIEARALAAHAWQINTTWLLAHDSDPQSRSNITHFESLIARRIKGEPVAYIVGEREFFGLKIVVTPDVLIPRPETEILVQAVLEKMNPDVALRVLDLGTGSGAIATALARHRPMANVLAVDISSAALAIAQINAQNLGITNMSFATSDWYDNLGSDAFDVIISNPPYVEAEDPHLNRGDACYEPVSARASGVTGMEDIAIVISGAVPHLAPQGWLAIEHGWKQGALCRTLFAHNNFSEIRTLLDLARHERVTLGRYTG